MASKRNQERTDVELAIVKFNSSTNIAPNKTCTSVIECSARQRDLGLRSVVIERGCSPRSDHCTPVDKDDVFHALNGQSYIP